jgi:hypothetical protein
MSIVFLHSWSNFKMFNFKQKNYTSSYYEEEVVHSQYDVRGMPNKWLEFCTNIMFALYTTSGINHAKFNCINKAKK